MRPGWIWAWACACGGAPVAAPPVPAPAPIVVRELPVQILPDGRLFAPAASLADCTE